MSLLIYNLTIRLYKVLMLIARYWNEKANNWLLGRKDLFTFLKEEKKKFPGKMVWMHCASLGEFEQGRPVLEKIKSNDPSIKILLTFYSPSGYEVMKHYKGADIICYLPLDTFENAKKFIAIANPDLVLWVKYEYWFHFLDQLHKRNIPVLLISGIFRKDQPFFSFFGSFWRRMLKCFDHFFLQDEVSFQLLKKIGFQNSSVSGDTRFDRVLTLSNRVEQVPYIAAFCASGRVIVAGSTWEDDELLLIHYVKANPQIRLIIAPHEVYRENLNSVKRKFSKSIFYSDWVNLLKETENIDNEGNKILGFNCLIIDNVGMLSSIYKYANICYVGGGFGAEGVHNVLEAAVYGKPVLFGPEYEKFLEAVDLIERGAAAEVKNAIDLEQAFDNLFNNENKRNKWGMAARDYVLSKAGATDQIIDFIYKKRLLTN